MRINKVQLAGLAVALVGATAGAAQAENVTISTQTNTPLSTSDPVAGGLVEAGNVTIASAGRITITAGQTGVTVDSDNNVTIESGGQINSTDADNVTAIAIEGGNSGTITNAGTISLLEDYTPADLPGDDDEGADEPDEPLAEGTARTGIWLQSGPAFVGDIINSGSINIEGNNSYGIRVDALLDDGGSLTGSINHTGSISVTGDNSVGIAITDTGAVAGDLLARGNVTARGENSVGMLVDGQVDGEVRVNGSWIVSGYRSLTRPADDTDVDDDDREQGGAAILVRDTIVGGLTIEGIGAEDDPNDDGDAASETDTDGDADDDRSASVTVYGSAPVIHVEADAASGSLVIGSGPAVIDPDAVSGFGLHVRGALTANGVFDDRSATAIFIEGDGADTATILGGIAIDNVVQSTAYASVDGGAEANGLRLGDGAITDGIRVAGTLNATMVSDELANAYALRLDDGAQVGAGGLVNRGTIRARVLGEQGTATAILDGQTAGNGTLTSITNSGSIIAEIVATDADLTDDIDPPPITGSAIAIDLRNSAQNVVLNQVDLGDFTDDDAEDNVGDPDIQIIGDVLFGTGDDLLLLEDGVIRGNVAFGDGADTLRIDGGDFYGNITNGAGALAIDVISGGLYHAGGVTNASQLDVADGSTLGITLATGGTSTVINVAGDVNIGDITIVPTISGGLPENSAEDEFVFLTYTGTLNIEPTLLGTPLDAEGLPFLYNFTITAADAVPDALQANYEVKTTTELGLTANQTAAFDPLLEALRRDDAAATAFANLGSEAEFFDAYEDLMPSYSSAAAEVATTAIQQMQGATSNRLAATRLQGLDEVSIWAQEIGYLVNRDPATANGQEFEGTGFGLAFGIDGPLENGNLFGLSASFIASEVEEAGRPEGEISTWFGQLNAYMGAATGPIDLDFIAGLGAGKMQSRRFVEIGDDFDALAEADWWAFEGHAAARASAPMRLADWFIVTPQVGLTYVAMSEQAYTEEGGGDAIDYDVDDAFSQRLWADAGLELSGRFALGGNNILAPRLFVGYRGNLIDEEAERTVRFVSGGDDFTLVDEGLGDGGPIVGLGVDMTNGYSTISLGYEGEFGDQIERHSLNAAIRFRF